MTRSQSRGRKLPQDSGLSGTDFYEVLGNPSAALRGLKTTGKGPVHDYNHLLLSHLASLKSSSKSSKNNNSSSSISSNNSNNSSSSNNNNNNNNNNSHSNDLVSKLQTWETQYQSSDKEMWVTPSARKRRRNNWIMSYNRALALYASGNSSRALQLCVENIKPVILEQQNVPDELIPVASRMSFLFLECILTMSIGSHVGVKTVAEGLSANDLVDWLDNTLNVGGGGDTDPELKFLLALYKSRVDFQQRDEYGKIMESKIRSARKELKHAMEIFQHKLRPSEDTASLDSSSYSGDHHQHHHHRQQQQQQQQQHGQVESTLATATTGSTSFSNGQQLILSRVLQGQNQAALNLKANTEQLKGNIKKSLILCGEAQTAVTEEEDTSYEAMHANNLALVFETNGRRHLALHTISKSLRINPPPSPFQQDGTARPDPSFRILYNSSLCAAQAQRFIAAYECMAICVQKSSEMNKRPRCWLRLAEACIGLYAKRKKELPPHKVARVEVEGKSRGIVLQNGYSRPIRGGTNSTNNENNDNGNTNTNDNNNLVSTFGSLEDLENVQKDPLGRATFALETALRRFEEQAEVDEYGLASARLAMSYVSLACRDFQKALKFAKLVMEHKQQQQQQQQQQQPESNTKTKQSSTDDDDGSSNTKTNNTNTSLVCKIMLQRQQATARMYASEASCALGDSMTSMRYLVGDGKDDAFDRLASELGGVTIETAATNRDGKSRLAKAQAMVRCSASAAYANLGNLSAARQLATSAQAMEDACSSLRERSLARRALLYCMLREGNSGAAFTLLRTVR